MVRNIRLASFMLVLFGCAALASGCGVRQAVRAWVLAGDEADTGAAVPQAAPPQTAAAQSGGGNPFDRFGADGQAVAEDNSSIYGDTRPTGDRVFNFLDIGSLNRKTYARVDVMELGTGTDVAGQTQTTPRLQAGIRSAKLMWEQGYTKQQIYSELKDIYTPEELAFVLVRAGWTRQDLIGVMQSGRQ